jgi:hypothetical protein
MKKILIFGLILSSLTINAQDKFYTKGLVNGYAWTDQNSTMALTHSKTESLGAILERRNSLSLPNSDLNKSSFPLDCDSDIEKLDKLSKSNTIELDAIVKMIDDFYVKKENLIIPVLGAYCCSVKKLSDVSPEEIEKYRTKLLEYSKN